MVAGALKCVLYWISWIIAQVVALTLEGVKLLASLTGLSVGGGWGSITVSLTIFCLSILMSLSILVVHWSIIDCGVWSLNATLVLACGKFSLIAESLMPFIGLGGSFSLSLSGSSSASALGIECEASGFYSPLVYRHDSALVRSLGVAMTISTIISIVSILLASVVSYPYDLPLILGAVAPILVAVGMILAVPKSFVNLCEVTVWLTTCASIYLISALLLLPALAGVSLRINARSILESIISAAIPSLIAFAIASALGAGAYVSLGISVIVGAMCSFVFRHVRKIFSEVIDRVMRVVSAMPRHLLVKMIASLLIVSGALFLSSYLSLCWAQSVLTLGVKDTPDVTVQRLSIDTEEYWCNFTIALKDDESIYEAYFDIVAPQSGSSWGHGHVSIKDYARPLELLHIRWDESRGAYIVEVYWSDAQQRWLTTGTVKPGETTTLSYNVGTYNNKPLVGVVTISVSENRKRVTVSWEGRVYPIARWLGVWVSDGENENATIFTTEDCGVAWIRPEEMRPICNRTDRVPIPSYIEPAKYIEVDGECFVLKDRIALAFVGCWRSLTITWSTGSSWRIIGPAVAHGFALCPRDWGAWDGASFTATADGARVSGVVRVVEWWEHPLTGVPVFCLAGVIIYEIVSRVRKRRSARSS